MQNPMIERFIGMVEQDPKLAAEMKHADSQATMATLAERLGRERGLKFTAEEFAAALHAITSSGELASDQLDQVVAGAGGILPWIVSKLPPSPPPDTSSDPATGVRGLR